MAGNLKENLNSILEKLTLEKSKNSQLVDPVVIAVSKKQSVEKIKSLNELGHNVFAENYWQEAEEKIKALIDLNIEWHFIGALQSKKIKEIVGNVELIHSVSRLVELEKISAIAKEKKIEQKILIQLNIANEESKSGVPVDEIKEFCQQAENFAHIKVCGLMVFPPLEDSEEKAIHWFQTAKTLFEELKQNHKEWDTLSMGTSSDYHLAYRCGATHLRVGESLMGSR